MNNRILFLIASLAISFILLFLGAVLIDVPDTQAAKSDYRFDAGSSTIRLYFGISDTTTTTTTITSDEPDPSKVGESVTVGFTVTSSLGTQITPTGWVSVTIEKDTEFCSGILSNGSGSCQAKINSAGTYTLTAIYRGDENFDPSSDSESHKTTDPLIYMPFVTKPCLALYSDDFSDPNSGWPDAPMPPIQKIYLDGEYHIILEKPDDWVYSVPGLPGYSDENKIENYILTVDIRNNSEVNAMFGVLIGGSDNLREFYIIVISSDQHFWIYRFDQNSEDTWVNLVEKTFSSRIKAGKALNHLKIERKENWISAYANGQLLVKISDDKYLDKRNVGVFVRSFEKPNVDVSFDNFRVYPPTCGVMLTPFVANFFPESDFSNHIYNSDYR